MIRITYRALRNSARLVSIGRTLIRYGALAPFERQGLISLLFVAMRIAAWPPAPPEVRAGRPGQRMAAALQALGPIFIKLGQTLATRSDLLGDQFAADLSELQDRLPPFGTSEARAIVEQELGRPCEDLFASFDDEPVAAASIAQVHYAVTPDGREVAVKILRPGIEAAFRRDVDLLGWIADLVERTQPALRRLRPREVVRIFAEVVSIEMDLRLEGAAAGELAENFAEEPDFRVPAVDWARTARRVLTLERIDGIRITDVDGIRAAGHEPRQILKRASEVFFQQVFRDGYFHADMHPGNVFVEPDGTLVPIDFGIMGRVDQATRRYLAEMLTGFLTGDYRLVADVHFRAGYVPADQDRDRFMQACRAIGEPIQGLPLREISIARLLAQLFTVTEQFRMETQPQLLLLQKTMLMAEGLGRALYPQENMWRLAEPLIRDYIRREYGPEARAAHAINSALESLEKLPHIIEQMDKAGAMIGDGGFKLDPETIAAIRGEGAPRGIYRLWMAVALALSLATAALVLML
ncbi:MAG: 2-polyprenylphenol 6-hydroxylase [Alphaproteobacteria bacterium]|nr:2-polyprenylphenol 6-hydroxylase [Alphaproteobacteria bacterium]